MANQGKHRKNPVAEWLDGEEGTVPTKSRGSHVIGSYIKQNKPALKKYRPRVVATVVSKTEVPLFREAGPPPKPDPKHTQPASFEHLRRLGRLGSLRAPYPYKGR